MFSFEGSPQQSNKSEYQFHQRFECISAACLQCNRCRPTQFSWRTNIWYIESVLKQLDLTDSNDVFDDVPENILKTAAEMTIYLNFSPPKNIVPTLPNMFDRFFRDTTLSVKEIIIGIYACDRNNFIV